MEGIKDFVCRVTKMMGCRSEGRGESKKHLMDKENTQRDSVNDFPV
jgi:hypothetical protein